MAIIVTQKRMNALKVQRKVVKIDSPIGSVAPEDAIEGPDPLLELLDKITAMLERPVAPAAAATPPYDDTAIQIELARLRKAIATPPPKRKFEFTFVRDNHDFITSIQAKEL